MYHVKVLKKRLESQSVPSAVFGLLLRFAFLILLRINDAFKLVQAHFPNQLNTMQYVGKIHRYVGMLCAPGTE